MTDLRHKAAEIRLATFKVGLAAGKGHLPGALSWADIAVALYYGGVLNVRPGEPRWPQRDRFILSKGHACLTLYTILADLGFITQEQLGGFGRDGSILGGHPDAAIPGVDSESGSLGHGLGVAVGMATAAKLNGESWRAFVVMGDGECAEGSVWESAMLAGDRRLDNLFAIVDCNGLGATGRTQNSIQVVELYDHFLACGWFSTIISGHNPSFLAKMIRESTGDGPMAFIGNTTKGKGVSFMEDSEKWHHQMPKGPQIDLALAELTRTLES